MYNQFNVIHRFWAGSPMPEEYKRFGQLWHDFNPDWDICEWTESDIPTLVSDPRIQTVIDDLYARDAGRKGIELYVQLADIVGYVLLEKFGGVYVNCDMQPVQPLPPLPDSAWASYENTTDGRIVNAAIGAADKFDPFWRYLLEELPHRYFANPGAEMVETTGPALLTDCARVRPTEIYVYPVETFNPIHWKQIQPGGDASSWVEGTSWEGTGTIAVHHWGHKKDHRSNHVETATPYA